MNLLYIAYSCSPYHGSEDKIGWNIPVESAKTNRVFVITKEEQRQYVEAYLAQNPLENIRFFYVDIPAGYKKVFRGPLYSGRLNVWNRRAFRLAKELCAREKIDVIHQIAPVEFRSIGNYGAIDNVKFVCGPIGGGERVPAPLKEYVRSAAHIEAMHSIVNGLYRWLPRTRRILRRVDHLLFANYENETYLQKICPKDLPTEVMTEVAIHQQDLSDPLEKENHLDRIPAFVVVGRLVYRKGHTLLLDALARLPKDASYRCRIVGEGKEMESLKKKCADLGLNDKVFLEGAVPYTQIGQIYDSADVLIMPSFREATGSVILEAMSKGLPVITIAKFGGATILDETTGWLYEGATKDAYINNLKDAIATCIDDPELVRQKGIRARKMAETFTWEEKMKHYQAIYQSVQAGSLKQ